MSPCSNISCQRDVKPFLSPLQPVLSPMRDHKRMRRDPSCPRPPQPRPLFRTSIKRKGGGGFKLFLCFALIFSCIGCDVIYRLLDKEGAEEKDLIGEVVPYEKNPTVQEIQTLLKIYGYDPGKIDGILGLRTRNALERFQKDNQLKVTRFADDETWKKLRVFKDNQLVVNGKLNVVFLQQLLTLAGYNPGPVDGKMGKKTVQAIKDFQKDNGLKVDGKVGYKTLSALSPYVPTAQNAE